MMLRVLIGLVVPFVAVDLMLPWANAVEFKILDIPFVFIWLFIWFILTSLCLTTCWLVFDRQRQDT